MLFQVGFPSFGGGNSGGLYDVLLQWQELGVYDVILPFLLVFTMVFAIMEKVKIFGDEKKNIHLIISLVVALLFLRNNYIVFIVGRFLPNVSLMLIVFLMFLLLFGIFGTKHEGWSGGALTLAFIVSIGAVILSLSTDILPFGEWGLLDFYYSLDSGTRGFVWLVILVAIVIGFVTHEGKEGKGFWKGLQDLVSGTKK